MEKSWPFRVLHKIKTLRISERKVAAGLGTSCTVGMNDGNPLLAENSYTDYPFAPLFSVLAA